MTSEYDLSCVTCGGSLTRREISGEALGLSVGDAVEVAECPDCGSRYFPESTLERLGSEDPGRPGDDGSGRPV